ncbi:MAG: hypothetical protein J1F35_01895 [Erysipelotrichales bacterium]|nr:hypothetical protein [Erysipelotrichales bacterium]
MGKYNFLDTLNKEQLLALQDVCEDQNLLTCIANILSDNDSPLYSSSREIYINEELREKYEDIAKNLKIDELKFLIDLGFKGPGNNKGLPSYIRNLDKSVLIYANKEVKELASAVYNINNMMTFSDVYNIGYTYQPDTAMYTSSIDIRKNNLVKELMERTDYFSYLDEFFSDEQVKEDCEGTYNCYMYIKEYIYQMLKINPYFSLENIFDESKKKKGLVTEYFTEICKYLYDLRESIPNSRLSVLNNKISNLSKQVPNKLSESQNKFIDMLSFGTTAEKLERKDFGDLQRIIYVPRNFYKH